jgi:hypothetical protein
MSGRSAKGMRRAVKETIGRQYAEIVDAMLRCPFKARVRFAWKILRGERKQEATR